MNRGQREAVDPLREQIDFSGRRTATLKAMFDGCAPDNHDRCADLFESAPGADSWSETDRLLLERYRSLISYPEWRELVPTDVLAPMPTYQDPIAGQRLNFLALRDKDSATMRAALESDLTFWRRLLASSDTLISKMIAAAGLRNHFYFGSLLMHGRSAADSAAAVPEQWSVALTPNELSMEKVMAGELAFSSDAIFHRLDWKEPVPDWLEEAVPNPLRWRVMRFLAQPFYQPQDDLNHFAAYDAAVAKAFAVPVEGFPAAARALQDYHEPHPFPSRVYDWVGDLYRADGYADLSQYGLRVATIEGWRRAALLTAELRARGIPAAQMPVELGAASLRNPFDGSSFTWDAGLQAVTYTGPENHNWRVQHYAY
jgi:hypothetical protein